MRTRSITQGRGRGTLTRSLALVAVAVFGLHELRCLLGAFGLGDGAGLGDLAPLLGGVGLLVLAGRLLRARMSGVAPVAISLARLSLSRQVALFAVAIAGLYLAEALAEGVLVAGAVGGLGIFGPGGLCVLPLAFALAPLCLLGDRWFGRLETLAAATGRPRERRRSPAILRFALDSVPTRAGISPLAFGLARRPPPLSFG